MDGFEFNQSRILPEILRSEKGNHRGNEDARAQAIPSLQDLAGESTWIMLCLPDTEDVEEVMFGKEEWRSFGAWPGDHRLRNDSPAKCPENCRIAKSRGSISWMRPYQVWKPGPKLAL